MAKVEVELEEVKAKIAALEDEIKLYKFPDERVAELETREVLTPAEKGKLRNLERFLARPLDGQGDFLDGLQRQLVELQGTFKELQRKENLLLEEKAVVLRRASESGREERDAKRRRLDNPTFVAECLSAARAFVTARGPELPWYEMVGDLPDLPLGSAYTRGLSGACDRDEGHVTHSIGSLLVHGEAIKKGYSEGEVRADAALGTLFQACTAVGGSHVHFNLGSPSSKGAGTKGTRPDTRVTIENFDVVRGESKTTVGNLSKARNELTAKLRPWSAAYYGDMPGILGIAAGGHKFEAHFIARDGASRKLVEGSLGEPDHLVRLARLVIAVVSYARVRVDDEGWRQEKDSVLFRVGDDGPRVDKTYGEARPLLVDFYAETREVPGLEKGAAETFTSSGKAVGFILTPHGCSRKPHPSEASTAMKQIAETVGGIHSKGWAHRDLRWPNVVLNCTKEGRRWTVIDCEYAARIRTPWADSHPPEDGWNEGLGLVDPIKGNDETVTVYRDYWMLGEMIAGLEGIDSDGELMSICEQLRAAVGDTYPDVDAANKARKDGFERLRTLA